MSVDNKNCVDFSNVTKLKLKKFEFINISKKV